MVVDTKLFVPNQKVPPNTLWVAEQLPGNITAADVSSSLNSPGYWASYNYPFFKNVLDASGDTAYQEAVGFVPDYGRRKIFRDQAPLVKDLPSMQAAMRYNNFRNDPHSRLPNCSGAVNNRCSPSVDPSAWFAIAARGDLVPIFENASLAQNAIGLLWPMYNGHLSGGSDSKVTSARMVNYSSLRTGGPGMLATIINGPTTSNGLPPFSWSRFVPSIVPQKPLEHPDTFDFPWISVSGGVQSIYANGQGAVPRLSSLVPACIAAGLLFLTIVVVASHQRRLSRRHVPCAVEEAAMSDDYRSFSY
jgi:hypothetical protein